MPMACYLKISCDDPSQQLELELHKEIPNMSSIDLTKCQTVFEDGSYKFDSFCIDSEDIQTQDLTVYVNGDEVGKVDFLGAEHYLTYYEEIGGKKRKRYQPFLLRYDLVILSVEVQLPGGQLLELFSDFLVCVSKNREDRENIQDMVKELAEFDDDEICKWLFSSVDCAKVGLHEGTWHHHSYKSLSSYVQLLEKISACYRNNFSYFKVKGKHTIIKKEVLSPYSRIRTVSRDNFNWLTQNLDQLSPVPCTTGIQYFGNNYIPMRMKTDVGSKSWDVYENRIVICFLYTVLNNAKSIHQEFSRDVLDQEKIISKMQSGLPREYHAPIITIKSLQISFSKLMVERLSQVIELLNILFLQYNKLFSIPINTLVSLPRRTKTFQEINSYAQVFELIVLWFKYGEFNLAKDKLILQVKTLDKLFEYYCLIKLLDLFATYGYQKAELAKPVYSYEYKINDGFYHNEKDVANTYILQKGNVRVTIYYQPIINSFGFENGLRIYRTTKSHSKPKRHYYAPDFVIKFTHPDHNEEYAIFDSKFSSRSNIRKHSLGEILLKYSCQVALDTGTAPKMVWILQGRVDIPQDAIMQYHDSPLAEKHRPVTSYGIVSVNTKAIIRQRLWDELKLSIPWLV